MSPRERISLFVLVGCFAAAVHWAVAVALVRNGFFEPLVANGAGWVVALLVSFAGQWRLTFGDHHAPLGRSFRRFSIVSLSGFLVNEAAYAALLRWSALRYDVLLLAVLLTVAAATFVASRRWAFRF
ncbi:MAG TPA: GtrA family protein [Rhizobacter sp.]|nr:GtrA family protein [Rhizobacter sp.]